MGIRVKKTVHQRKYGNKWKGTQQISMQITMTMWSPYIFSPEWLKLKRLTMPNPGEDMAQFELFYSAVGNVNRNNCFGNSLVVFI